MHKNDSRSFKKKATHFVKYIERRPFFILLGGAGFAHLINFVSAPLLTRLYMPEAFGLLSLFATSLAVAGAVAGGRYDQAITGETSDKFADDLVYVVGVLALFFASLLPFIFIGIASFLDSRTHLADTAKYLAPAVFAYSLAQALANWLIRKGQFSTTSISKVFQALTVFGASIILANLTHGLVIASMIGYIASCLTLGAGAYRYGWSRALVNLQDLRVVLRRHIRFPLMGVLPALFDSFAMLLPVYWIAIYFSTIEAGYFGLTRQVLAAPAGMISLVLSQILMKRLADAKATQESMLPAIRQAFIFLTGPALLLGLSISLAGPEIFHFLFGEEWRPAGSIARWMVWVYIAPMLVSPLSIVLIVLRKIGVNSIWQTAHCAAVFLMILFGIYRDIEQFVQVLVVVELLSYVAYAALIARVAYAYEKERYAE